MFGLNYSYDEVIEEKYDVRVFAYCGGAWVRSF